MDMICRVFCGALLAALAMLQAPPAQAQRTLFVAEPTHGVGYLPLYVAIRNGYFAKDGLDVKVMTVDGGSTHTNAVLTGQAFAFIGGPEHNAYAKLKGGELRAVANVVDRGNVYFTARVGSEPKAGQEWPAYFKGKSFAVGLYGGTPNSITRYLLKKWNLDARNDVTLIEMTTSAVLAGVKSGRAEIGVTSEPLLTQGVKAGLWTEPVINIPRELGPYAYSTLNVRLESITKEPERPEIRARRRAGHQVYLRRPGGRGRHRQEGIPDHGARRPQGDARPHLRRRALEPRRHGHRRSLEHRRSRRAGGRHPQEAGSLRRHHRHAVRAVGQRRQLTRRLTQDRRAL
jgi:NMT1/THI5 like protein